MRLVLYPNSYGLTSLINGFATEMVVEKVLVPSGLEQERTYVVVLSGVTPLEPDGAWTLPLHCLGSPVVLDASQDWALEHVQESVDPCGGTITIGAAPKSQLGNAGVVAVIVKRSKHGPRLNRLQPVPVGGPVGGGT